MDAFEQWRATPPGMWSQRLPLLERIAETGSPDERREALFWLGNERREAGDWEGSRDATRRLFALLEEAQAPADSLPHFAVLADTGGLLDLAIRAEALRGAVPGREATRRRRDRALEIRAALAARAPVFLPVGEQCLPFNVLMRWGFARHAPEGPWTACNSRESGTSRALNERLAAFGDPAAYRPLRAPSGVDTPVLPAYGCLFPHEASPHFTADGFMRLAALYARRAATFLDAAAGGPVVFVVERHPQTDLGRLLAALEGVAPHGRFRLVTLDHPGTPPADDRRVHPAAVAPPGGGYTWYHADSYDTEAGFAYEEPMARALLEAGLSLG